MEPFFCNAIFSVSIFCENGRVGRFHLRHTNKIKDVSGPLIAGIAGSNPSGYVCLLLSVVCRPVEVSASG